METKLIPPTAPGSSSREHLKDMSDVGLCHAAAGGWGPLKRRQLQTERSWLGPADTCTFASSVILEEAELRFCVKPPLGLFAKAVWISFVSTRGTGTEAATLAGYPGPLTGARMQEMNGK